MQDHEPTSIGEIVASLDFYASYEGRTVRKILEAGLQKQLESFLSYLHTQAEEALMKEDSYW